MLHKEQQRAREEKLQTCQDLSRPLETVLDMAVTLARIEKRTIMAEVSIETSELERVPPLAPTTPIPHISIIPAEVGQYDMLPPGMPIGAPPHR